MLTRRHFLRTASATSLALSIEPSLGRALPVQAVFHNPILGGDHPDASPIRVGDDFYLTHSSFDYAPGLQIWHSRDLVNWKAVAAALQGFHGIVWAPYLCEHAGRYYIYFPADGKLSVVHAPHPTGPWSAPIDLGIQAIDPAHIAENGRRFLYMNGGLMAELTPDGLGIKTPPRHVFDPWPIPPDIRIECTCLEAPKLLQHNGWFYLTVAEGGTSGPATSHMVVSMRSRHAEGPWEFSPYNPIAHTASRTDRWLSVGHGRLVDTPDGRWLMTVHAYENGFYTLGRQLLLLPVEWTADGWFRVQPGIAPDAAIPMPVAGTTQAPPSAWTDDFSAPELNLTWGFWRAFDRTRFTTGRDGLRLAASGKSLEDTSVLATAVGGHAYTVEVEVEIEAGCEAGLLLFYSPDHAVGLTLSPAGPRLQRASGRFERIEEQATTRATLRLVNDAQEIDFYLRPQGQPWQRTTRSAEISGLHHNVLGGFLDVRPALAAWGTGHATFRSFRYWPEVAIP